jgi:hypothetical protein
LSEKTQLAEVSAGRTDGGWEEVTSDEIQVARERKKKRNLRTGFRCQGNWDQLFGITVLIESWLMTLELSPNALRNNYRKGNR